MRAAVITVSTSKAAGRGEDVSGPKLRELLEGAGCEVIAVELIPDERELVAGRLRFYADEEGCDLIATTGGTGLSRDDVTPEATRDVIDREAPGIAEAMRLASREHVPDHWFLSRGVAGTRDRTLIVNFPGNPNAIEQAGAAITPSLGHALGLLSGRTPRH
jgi:molybdopterin adenylyltransferase